VLILLPPSETKRDGGEEGSSLDLALLGHPELSRPRRAVIASTRRLSRNRTTMAAALGLSPKQSFEVERNRQLSTSPTMAALDRYTGVLYDALDAQSLDAAARRFASAHVAVHSALFGLVGAADPIPAYRLSHNSRLPDLALRSTWRDAVSSVLARHEGLIIDLRSEAYVDLGPIPAGRHAFFVRVVAEGPDGRARALNHFNKKGKGVFVRRLIEAGIDHGAVESLLDWAAASGIPLSRKGESELELVVD
jgi:cytoplasmic iron level regulating protein YaaA (DUF328/UPF0246 family)